MNECMNEIIRVPHEASTAEFGVDVLSRGGAGRIGDVLPLRDRGSEAGRGPGRVRGLSVRGKRAGLDLVGQEGGPSSRLRPTARSVL